MMSFVCAAVIGAASPCLTHTPSVFAHIPTVSTKGPRLNIKHDRLPRADRSYARAEPLRERFYPLPADLAVIAHLEPMVPVPTPAPERPRVHEPVIARQEVDRDVITAAYARIDRPAIKAPLPLPNYGETEKKAGSAIANPLSSRAHGAIQRVSAPGGLRDLVRRTEDEKQQQAERKAEGNFRGLYVLADGNEDMRCVKKNARLMAALRKVRAKYGKAVVVDSAYRSPSYNRKVSGAKNSYHMSCRALDISVAGIGKDALRNYIRTLPEIGGVGIYASGSIHMDTGPVRNWDWRRKSRKSGTEV
jgi:uncharacterized protein YcbK (DUF882 family)